MKKRTYRHSAGFGKRMEHWIIGRMLKDGLDVYVPLVDDMGIDAVIRREDGSFIEVQIKARSNSVTFSACALFAAIEHKQRDNYWFIFYSERLDCTWVMTSEQFIKESVTNKSGKNKGKHAIWFNGRKTDRKTKEKSEYPKPRFDKYKVDSFQLLK
jgi:hypothetical protein